jgi:hypothetical protein
MLMTEPFTQPNRQRLQVRNRILCDFREVVLKVVEIDL